MNRERPRRTKGVWRGLSQSLNEVCGGERQALLESVAEVGAIGLDEADGVGDGAVGEVDAAGLSWLREHRGDERPVPLLEGVDELL